MKLSGKREHTNVGIEKEKTVCIKNGFIFEKGINIGEVYVWMKDIEQGLNEREFRNIGKFVQMKVCVVWESSCLQVRMFRTGVSVWLGVGPHGC